MLQVSNGIEALDAFSLELIFQNPCKKKLWGLWNLLSNFLI
jgi:hypothetical protein